MKKDDAVYRVEEQIRNAYTRYRRLYDPEFVLGNKDFSVLARKLRSVGGNAY